MTVIIENNVVGSTYLHRTEFKNFQGDLKKQNNDADIEKLSQRILKGFDAPIYVWYEHNNFILDGHQRLKALNKLADDGNLLEDDKIPVVYIKADTEKEAKEKVLEYNSKYSEFNVEELELFSQDLDLEGINIEGLDTEGEDEELDHKNEDKIPDAPEEIHVKEGDIFKLGDHTLMCGDSMKDANIKLLLKEKNHNKTHCISDPPYGISYTPDSFEMIKNDDKILDYTDLAKKYTDGYFAMRTGYQVVDERSKMVKKTFEKLTNMIIRHKGGGGMGDTARNLAQDFEILLVSNRGNFLSTDYRGNSTRYRNMEEKQEYIKKANKDELKETLLKITGGDVMRKVGKDNSSEYMHPTQKPIEINQRVLENFTGMGENVLDLFGGSGSNLIACEKVNRNCYMMELDPQYVQVIIKRYNEYTKGHREIKCLNRDLDINIITE